MSIVSRSRSALMFVCAIIALGMLVSKHAKAQEVKNFKDGPFKGAVETITGLNIDGTTYDVTFKHAKAFREVYSKKLPMFRGSKVNAEKASKAVKKIVAQMGDDPLGSREYYFICYFIPYKLDISPFENDGSDLCDAYMIMCQNKPGEDGNPIGRTTYSAADHQAGPKTPKEYNLWAVFTQAQSQDKNDVQEGLGRYAQPPPPTAEQLRSKLKGLSLPDGFKHEPSPLGPNGEVGGVINGPNNLKIEYRVAPNGESRLASGQVYFSSEAMLLKSGDHQWSRAQYIGDEYVQMTLAMDNRLVVSYPGRGINMVARVNGLGQLADATLVALSIPNSFPHRGIVAKSWDEAKKIIETADVKRVTQKHDGVVNIHLADNTRITTKLPSDVDLNALLRTLGKSHLSSPAYEGQWINRNVEELWSMEDGTPERSASAPVSDAHTEFRITNDTQTAIDIELLFDLNNFFGTRQPQPAAIKKRLLAIAKGQGVEMSDVYPTSFINDSSEENAAIAATYRIEPSGFFIVPASLGTEPNFEFRSMGVTTQDTFLIDTTYFYLEEIKDQFKRKDGNRYEFRISALTEPATPTQMSQEEFDTAVNDYRQNGKSEGFEIVADHQGKLKKGKTHTEKIPSLDPAWVHYMVAMGDGCFMKLDLTDQNGNPVFVVDSQSRDDLSVASEPLLPTNDLEYKATVRIVDCPGDECNYALLVVKTDRRAPPQVAPLDMSKITVGPDNTISWDDAKTMIKHGKVKSVYQSHSLSVRINMANGDSYKTTEPKIDAVIRWVEECGKSDWIGIMTE